MKNFDTRTVFGAAALLVIIGFFACKNEAHQPTETPVETKKMAEGQTIDSTFRNLFEEVNVVKMHLFGTNELEPKQDAYPYAGKKIEEAQMKYLGDGLQANEIGGVYACYRTEAYNLYILRVPGKYASSDLALAKWDDASQKLVKVMDLASIQCDEGYCIQQDAWLTDLDDNRVLDLITHSMTNDNGKISDEKFTVFDQPTPGNFSKAPEALASLAPITSYVMHQKM